MPFDRRSEVEKLLGSEEFDTGRLWRMRRQGLEEATMATRLGGTAGHYNNIELQLSVLLEGHIPRARSRALKSAQKLSGWLRDQALTDELRRFLTAQEAELRSIADGQSKPVTGGPKAPTSAVIDWPTIEWVKDPVAVETGLPNGQPIVMRHFTECTHWFRGPDGSWIGDPPRLASNGQMESLPACNDCIRDATKHNNPPTGPRTSFVSEVEQLPVEGFDLTQSSDAMSLVRQRVEQRFLRRALLHGREEAPCALCGRAFPAALLIAAHIVPRHRLTEAERYDFVIAAMLACSLGCDALFEAGYLGVDESGRVEARRKAPNETVREVVHGLAGSSVTDVAPESAPRFAEHRRLHSR